MRVRRIKLPTGKVIEIAVRGYAAGEARLPAAQEMHPTRDPLYRCQRPGCGSDLVYPQIWEEAGSDHWWAVLRCPECEWTEEGEFEQSLCDVFDDEFTRGVEVLTRDYQRLVVANLSDDITRFVKALAANAILPEDFGCPSP